MPVDQQQEHDKLQNLVNIVHRAASTEAWRICGTCRIADALTQQPNANCLANSFSCPLLTHNITFHSPSVICLFGRSCWKFNSCAQLIFFLQVSELINYVILDLTVISIEAGPECKILALLMMISHNYGLEFVARVGKYTQSASRNIWSKIREFTQTRLCRHQILSWFLPTLERAKNGRFILGARFVNTITQIRVDWWST